MENEKEKCCGDDCCGESCCHKKTKFGGCGACGGAVYGLGLIGAAIYFIGKAGTFWVGVLGFLKAIVWPAFLVYQAFKLLGL